MSQMQLMTRRRFWPLFWVAFLTAFNDNLFKQGLIVLLTMKSLQLFGLGSDVLTAMTTVLIMIPFVLLSATAGQVLDRGVKSRAIRKIKAAEIAIMGLGAYGMFTQQFELLMLVLLLTGVQSTFFSPAKYSMLPELLDDEELVGGNALIEMGTFLSVLLGTITGGILVGVMGLEHGPQALGAAIVVVALIGFVIARFVPDTPAANPDLEINYNPVTPNVKILRETRKDQPVFLSIMGLSWFWFVGTGVMAVIPAYADRLFHGNELGVTYFMALFSVGIGIGSLLCERFSRHGLELGLVPFGSIGMSLFLADLFFIGMPTVGDPATSLKILQFLSSFQGIRISFDLFMFALFGGIFTVPLYTMVQANTGADRRSRVIAGLNIISSLFMLVAGGMATVMLAQKISVPVFYLVLAIMNVLVAVFIYRLLPVFLWRFLVVLVTGIAYRFEVNGRENIPQEGRAVLACNHPSFIDFTFVAVASQRPARFIMHYSYFEKPGWRWLFEQTRVIPIARQSEDERMLKDAFEQIAEALEEDELVCIFPEGMVSRDGKLGTFRRGIEEIVERTPSPVVPMALKGMWGSFFSFQAGKPMTRLRQGRLFRDHVELDIGPMIPAEQVSADELARRIAGMGGWDVPDENLHSSSEEE